MRDTLKNFCFWNFFEKKNKKSFQKLKQFYVLKTLSFRKSFLNKNICFKKILFLFRKHFHFCLQIKIFSLHKQKQFYFRFENTFISQMFSK